MEKFETWAILELLGHRRIAGFVTEVEIAGHGMLRVDIPIDPPATQFISPASLYCLTPSTEATVRAVASAMAKPEPVHVWEIQAHAFEDGVEP